MKTCHITKHTHYTYTGRGVCPYICPLSMSCEPWLNAAIKHSLVAMPVCVLHSRNLIDMNSPRFIQCLQTKGIIDVELHRKRHKSVTYSTRYVLKMSLCSCLHSVCMGTCPLLHCRTSHALLVAFGILEQQGSHRRMQSDCVKSM